MRIKKQDMITILVCTIFLLIIMFHSRVNISVTIIAENVTATDIVDFNISIKNLGKNKAKISLVYGEIYNQYGEKVGNTTISELGTVLGKNEVVNTTLYWFVPLTAVPGEYKAKIYVFIGNKKKKYTTDFLVYPITKPRIYIDPYENTTATIYFASTSNGILKLSIKFCNTTKNLVLSPKERFRVDFPANCTTVVLSGKNFDKLTYSFKYNESLLVGQYIDPRVKLHLLVLNPTAHARVGTAAFELLRALSLTRVEVKYAGTKPYYSNLTNEKIPSATFENASQNTTVTLIISPDENATDTNITIVGPHKIIIAGKDYDSLDIAVDKIFLLIVRDYRFLKYQNESWVYLGGYIVPLRGDIRKINSVPILVS